jgi:clan AA aspartic protease (TIGR02281 family)
VEEIHRLGTDGRAAEAAALAEDAVSRFPTEPVFLVRLAEARFLQKSWVAAIEALKGARDLTSDAQVDAFLEEVYLSLVSDSAAVGDTRAQETNLLAGLQDLPSSANLSLELGKLYMKLDALADAIPLLQRAAELSPTLRPAAEDLLGKIDDILKRRDAVIIPIEADSRAIKAQATVDGALSVAFIIDTGATYTTIPSSVAKTLGYDTSIRTARINIATAAGILSVPMIRVQSVSLGGYMVRNIDVLVIPESIGPNVGLLGLNFLNHFKYTVDAARSEFRLERP